MSERPVGAGGAAGRDSSDDLFGSSQDALPTYLRRTIDLTDASRPRSVVSGRSAAEDAAEQPSPDDRAVRDLLAVIEKRLDQLDARLDELPSQLEGAIASALAPLVARLDGMSTEVSDRTPPTHAGFGELLAGVAGVGPRRLRALEERFEDVVELVAASAVDLCEVPGIGPDLAARISAVARDSCEPGDAEPT
jgi:transposase